MTTGISSSKMLNASLAIFWFSRPFQTKVRHILNTKHFWNNIILLLGYHIEILIHLPVSQFLHIIPNMSQSWDYNRQTVNTGQSDLGFIYMRYYFVLSPSTVCLQGSVVWTYCMFLFKYQGFNDFKEKYLQMIQFSAAILSVI